MHDSPRRGEVALAVMVLGLGVVLSIATYRLPAAPGYSQVGPGVVPAIVSTGLLIVGAALVLQATRGGLRDMPAPEGGAFDSRAFLWVSAGLLLHAALIGIVGFVVASAALFTMIARAFCSTRWLRDASVGLTLAAMLYWLFTQVLGLSLGPTLGRIFI